MADRHLTDLELERHLAGDLPTARFAEATPADTARLADLRAEQEAFLRTVDVDMEVKRIHQRVERAAPERAPRAWLRWLVPAGALAAAAAVLLVVIRRGDSPARHDDDLQVKGDDIALVVHLATGDGSRRLTTGDAVHAGDRLRFEIDAVKPGFVAILGIDGTGQPTVYQPANGNAPLAYDPKDRILPGAIELDATPGDERFYALYSERVFDVAAAVAALVGKSPLPPGIAKAEITLPKK